ncbi:MAG: hypothetical protein PHD95_02520 [Candidatus ainarchaeum sp.]|nr:hypothetical protein [Candidatus ainarchaeum sp.]
MQNDFLAFNQTQIRLINGFADSLLHMNIESIFWLFVVLWFSIFAILIFLFPFCYGNTFAFLTNLRKKSEWAKFEKKRETQWGYQIIFNTRGMSPILLNLFIIYCIYAYQPEISGALIFSFIPLLFCFLGFFAAIKIKPETLEFKQRKEFLWPGNYAPTDYFPIKSNSKKYSLPWFAVELSSFQFKQYLIISTILGIILMVLFGGFRLLG